MTMLAGMVIAALISGLVAWMIYASSGPPDEERYCLKCGKTTQWHPKNGCTVCRTLDQCF